MFTSVFFTKWQNQSLGSLEWTIWRVSFYKEIHPVSDELDKDDVWNTASINSSNMLMHIYDSKTQMMVIEKKCILTLLAKHKISNLSFVVCDRFRKFTIGPFINQQEKITSCQHSCSQIKKYLSSWCIYKFLIENTMCREILIFGNTLVGESNDSTLMSVNWIWSHTASSWLD